MSSLSEKNREISGKDIVIKRKNEKIKNKELRNHLAAIDRDPLDLSKKVLKAISKQIEAAVRETLRRV